MSALVTVMVWQLWYVGEMELVDLSVVSVFRVSCLHQHAFRIGLIMTFSCLDGNIDNLVNGNRDVAAESTDEEPPYGVV